MAHTFDYSPTPAVLQWLSGGQLASRWQRAVRLWWLLRAFYGSKSDWLASLPTPFRYGDLRAQLFAPSHGTADQASAEKVTAGCRGSRCICQRTLRALLQEAEPNLDWQDWLVEMAQYTGLPLEQVADATAPFAVGHRSIRDDMKALVEQGWLKRAGRGQFSPVPAAHWPQLIQGTDREAVNGTSLSQVETEELLTALDAVAFVQPNLEILRDRLWEQANPSGYRWWEAEPERRVFIHLDYILSPETQEQVDTHQALIEDLWRTHNGGMVQFDYCLARQERVVTVVVYPVCLHYARRAKYLSAYGLDPDGKVRWHNYRLDRVVSEQMRVLPWGDPMVPKELKEMRDCGELPTSGAVEAALAAAWGFNFYLPKAWLLMRFPAEFARWYVDNTERHPTFGRVDYGELNGLVQQQVPGVEQEQVSQVIGARSSADAYYAGWIRLGDINVVMRLRDWRPKGEVIAPWQLRRQMAAEARAEVGFYEGC